MSTKLSIKKDELDKPSLEDIKSKYKVISENLNILVVEADTSEVKHLHEVYHALEQINE